MAFTPKNNAKNKKIPKKYTFLEFAKSPENRVFWALFGLFIIIYAAKNVNIYFLKKCTLMERAKRTTSSDFA